MLRVEGESRLLENVEMPGTCLHRYRTYRPTTPFAQINYQGVPRGHDYYWAIEHRGLLRIAYLITESEVEDRRPKVKTIVPAYYRREEPKWEKKLIVIT